MTSLKSQFNAIGAQVIYCNTMPELRQDVRTINGIVQPVFAPNVIDLYALTVDPSNIPRLLPAYASSDNNNGNATVQPIITGAIDPFIP